MCIRDSGWTIAKYLLTHEREMISGFGAAAKKSMGQMAVEAVSYTHLRAHETVLDLVCRLLLENKKLYSTEYTQIKAQRQ